MEAVYQSAEAAGKTASQTSSMLKTAASTLGKRLTKEQSQAEADDTALREISSKFAEQQARAAELRSALGMASSAEAEAARRLNTSLPLHPAAPAAWLAAGPPLPGLACEPRRLSSCAGAATASAGLAKWPPPGHSSRRLSCSPRRTAPGLRPARRTD